MKRTLALTLVVLLASVFSASAEWVTPEEIGKEVYYDAIDAYQSGNFSKAQYNILGQTGYFAQVDNALLNMGGPDGFGYLWKDSEEANGPEYNWYDISATGTSVIGSMSDDNTAGPYPIGFSFPFYGSGFTQFYIGSNGGINFDGAYISLSNYQLPSTSCAANICIFNDDLDPADPTDADLLYEVVNDGNQDILVISCLNWDEYPGYTDPAAQESITMQYQLFEDGTIQLHYQTVEAGFDIAGGTIGIQNTTQDIGLTALYNGSIAGYPYDGLAIEFSPLPADASLSGHVTDDDSGIPVEGADVMIGTFTATTNAQGYYEFSSIYSGTYNVLVTAPPDYFDFEGTVTVETGPNTYDIQLQPIEEPTFFYDFEDDQGPFSAVTAWEYGTPTANPPSAYSGEYAWGVHLGTSYNNNEDSWLTSTETYTIENEYAYVSYMHWYDYESGWDGYNFKISTDGGSSWTTLTPDIGYPNTNVVGLDGEPGFTNDWNNPGPGEGNWAYVTYYLGPSYAGEDVMFAFRHGTDGSVTYPGVTIDDFGVFTGQPAGPVEFDIFGQVTEIPPGGGTILYDVSIVSTLQLTIPNLWYWTEVELPNGQIYGPLFQLRWTHVPFMDIDVVGLSQNVPAAAPSGTYVFYAWIGLFGGPNLSDSFEFTKVGVAADGVDNWDAGGNFIIAGDAAASVSLPRKYVLEQVYPNPFNPTANVTVALPEAADLSVTVFNVMGQQVAELASGMQNAGIHNFALDGSALSSGVYFVKAYVPGELDQIQKVTLMK